MPKEHFSSEENLRGCQSSFALLSFHKTDFLQSSIATPTFTLIKTAKVRYIEYVPGVDSRTMLDHFNSWPTRFELKSVKNCKYFVELLGKTVKNQLTDPVFGAWTVQTIRFFS